MNLTSGRLQAFIEALERAGGSSGNKSLRLTLGWDEEFYWKVQGVLISQGRIATGRGYGGSVRLIETGASSETAVTQGTPTQASGAVPARERLLYSPMRESIEKKWINRFAFDNVLVGETHSRGSKDTGGTFTRPDITAVGIRSYVFLSKRLEVVTFEVKSAEAVSVVGVLEAIAHHEGSHRAYVIYATSRAIFEESSDAERIMELAQKYGVGVVLSDEPDDVESWEVLLDAIRHEPDPARLDRFLTDLPDEDMKKQLSKWKG